MEDLDFTKPSQSAIYDPETALAFFKSGTIEEKNIAQGEIIFMEQQTRRGLFRRDDEMYLLVEGQVSLMIGKKVIDILKPGEIFGEMAPITEMPRSATALARTACRLLAMKKSRFIEALGRTPEFALMLMSIMINRLRLTNSRLAVTHALSNSSELHEGRVFERAVLDKLLHSVANQEPRRFTSRRPIISSGEAGTFMYVVLKGRVEVSLDGTIIERIGPGGVLGEMALVDAGPRAASAVAETDCSLLAIRRDDFLDLVKNDPDFGVALLKTLADRLRFMTSRLAAAR